MGNESGLPHKIQSVPDMFTKILLGAVAVGFTAWAGVVYNTGSQALQAVQLNDHRIEVVTGSLVEHKDNPWHEDTGLQLTETRTKLKGIDDKLQRIERTLEQMIRDKNGQRN